MREIRFMEMIDSQSLKAFSCDGML